MKYAIDTLSFGDLSDVRLLADFAREAETAGWDGFFIWDHMAMPWPESFADVTVALTAIALATTRVRFGAQITPLPRRRPLKFARETATLDRLSGGRLVVGVGIGADEELSNLGEAPDSKVRGAMLDEGLEVLTALWRGETVNHSGQYYTVKDTQFMPTPVQQPRIPIWVAGMWPNKAPFRRAARWDGVCPGWRDAEPNQNPTPVEVREVVDTIMQHRKSADPFEVVIGGCTPGDDPARAAEIVAPYTEVGVTWWQESINPLRFLDRQTDSPGWAVEVMRERIRQGPPM